MELSWETTDDDNDLSHGFLMNKQGVFTTFDTPSAGTGPGQGTYPWGVNTKGEITGCYVDEDKCDSRLCAR